MKISIVRILLALPALILFVGIAHADDFKCILFIAGKSADGAVSTNLRNAEDILYNGTLSSEEKLLPQAGAMILPKAAHGFPELPLFNVEGGEDGSVVVSDEHSNATQMAPTTALVKVYVELYKKTLVFGCAR